jgi:hypothetical protein
MSSRGFLADKKGAKKMLLLFFAFLGSMIALENYIRLRGLVFQSVGISSPPENNDRLGRFFS